MTGARRLAEALTRLGATAAFGVPGIHSLAIWDALRDSPVRLYGARTELCAGFAADGFARTTGRPAPLLLSTGPGALNSLTALMESASSHVPVVAISSQIPLNLIGRGRGYLHEMDDQLACFAPLVKYAARANSAGAIEGLLARAWAIAQQPPAGPVYLEIPVDLLTAPTEAWPAGAAAAGGVAATRLAGAASPDPAADPADVTSAALLLAGAEQPVLWVGGGVISSGAEPELLELAELLGAPVVTTYMGKGALPDDHPLAAGAGCDEAAFAELIGTADVVLAAGTELGAETTRQYDTIFNGKLIHLDVEPGRIGTTYPAFALVGEAKATLRELIGCVAQAGARARPDGPARAARVRERISVGLAAQGRETELGMLAAIESALPAGVITTWDMTILAYWAAPHLRLRAGQRFCYPLGSGTLGYAWPAAIGASAGHPGRPVLAVCGDGGLQYALAELGTAVQYGVAAKLLLIDDGGYGILREYQRESFGQTTAADLRQPDFAGLAREFGLPVRTGGPGDLAGNLKWAFSEPGPAMVVVRALLTAARPTQ